MKKKLKVSGNGWSLYFSKPLLQLLGYNPKETKILITSKNNTLFFEPVCENDLEKYGNKMVKGFHKSGGSYGIYLSQTLLEVLDIDPVYDYVDIEIDVDKMTVKGLKK